jgi:hypothetical protein
VPSAHGWHELMEVAPVDVEKVPATQRVQVVELGAME